MSAVVGTVTHPTPPPCPLFVISIVKAATRHKNQTEEKRQSKFENTPCQQPRVQQQQQQRSKNKSLHPAKMKRNKTSRHSLLYMFLLLYYTAQYSLYYK